MATGGAHEQALPGAHEAHSPESLVVVPRAAWRVAPRFISCSDRMNSPSANTPDSVRRASR